MTEQTEIKILQVFERYSKNNNEAIPANEAVDLLEEIKLITNDETSINKVKLFMQTFNQKVAYYPTEPDEDTKKLRLSLMLEELFELATAFGSESLSHFGMMLYNKSNEARKKCEDLRENLVYNEKEVFDALNDQRYVNDGTIISCGMQDAFEKGFDNVHESNMSKACKTEIEAINTQNKYANDGIEVDFEEKHDKCFLILRKEDRKVLKSINYKPTNLQPILNEYKNLRKSSN